MIRICLGAVARSLMVGRTSGASDNLSTTFFRTFIPALLGMAVLVADRVPAAPSDLLPSITSS
jgi:hypothetical protein